MGVNIKPSSRKFYGQPLLSKKEKFVDSQRTISAAHTFKIIKPHFNKFGITRIANVTGLDRLGIPVIASIRPTGKSICTSAGKGVTMEQSMVSAAMEAIEFHHAENIENVRITSSYNQLKETYNIAEISEFPLRKHSIFHPDLLLEWLIGWDIVAQEEIPVPFEMVTMNFYEYRLSKRLHLFQAGSNGLSSGNNLLEAIISGIYEVIERDAVTLCKLQEKHGKPMKRIAHESIPYKSVNKLILKLLNSEILPLIFDCTVDSLVPTFSAVLYDKRPNIFSAFSGDGTHLDPEIALIRALTEAIQGRAIYIAGSRDDVFIHDELHAKRNSSNIPNEMAGFDFREINYKNLSDPYSFEYDLDILINNLNSIGVSKIIVLDLSKFDLDISVVKVIIPGLEGYLSDIYSPGPRAIKLMNELHFNPSIRALASMHSMASKGI